MVDYDKIFNESIMNKFKTFPSKNDKNGLKKEYINKYNFKTNDGNAISYDVLIEAEKKINRNFGRTELLKYLKEHFLAYEMEKGLFEYSLIKLDDLQVHFVSNIYLHRLKELCRNLDVTDKSIQNKTLLKSIIHDSFDPYFVPFLSPEQMHPEKWKEIIKKRDRQTEISENFKTTDVYKCKRCGMRKFRTKEIQLRSADEGANIIASCMNCYLTFIK
jgi:DNA-directed RNA polymerase subunit M/transcription elongation factor TFIIS